uniref:Citrate lyase beta like n=1 Tax=Oncorhynchus mykiss TaxID=8022 RepID=A0A8C7W5T8_ONCMY
KTHSLAPVRTLPRCHGGCRSHRVAGTNLRYMPRCAVLYCPGNNERKLRKMASLSGQDCAVLDWEDGVALSKKVLLDTHRVSLTEPIYLVTLVEIAVRFLKFRVVCEEVCCLAPTVGLHNDGVVFGSDDFCANIGRMPTKDARELLHVRHKVVVMTKAFSLQAIDLVSIDYEDGGLQQLATEGALMGFTAKQVFHPKQVQAAQEEFSSSQERHQKQGKIHFFMIDMPSVKQAQSIAMLAAAVTGK